MHPGLSYGWYSRNSLRHFSDEHFEQLSAFRDRMASAEARCKHVAGSEKFLGYDDSWRAYMDLANEIATLYAWMQEVLP